MHAAWLQYAPLTLSKGLNSMLFPSELAREPGAILCNLSPKALPGTWNYSERMKAPKSSVSRYSVDLWELDF